MENETELYTLTLCREDWDRIVESLRFAAVTNFQLARRVGSESIYGSALHEEGDYCNALADQIEFTIPE